MGTAHHNLLPASLLRVDQAARRPLRTLRLGKRHLALGRRTIIMGILNLTPDSFTDGGQFNTLEKAVARARQMAAQGADIIDIGGESTRPGFKPVPEEEELERVMPVITALKDDPQFNTPLSIDTYKAGVARRALEAGVEMVNDVWGLKKEPRLAEVAAAYKVPLCLMHNRNDTNYRDLISEVIEELEESIALALTAGVTPNNIIIDPGIGFGKDLAQNLAVMRRLPLFLKLGYPILLGTSRKSMIGKTLDLPENKRVEGTAATVTWGVISGVDIIRVHDVLEMSRVITMTEAMMQG
ncbi:MAG: dihydropteroate synthase [Firmicutes bacterium]|nr:dihydropteroate synthase [Bacillota bacterium]